MMMIKYKVRPMDKKETVRDAVDQQLFVCYRQERGEWDQSPKLAVDGISDVSTSASCADTSTSMSRLIVAVRIVRSWTRAVRLDSRRI